MKIISKKALKKAVKEFQQLEKKRNKVYEKFQKKYKINAEAEDWVWDFFGFSADLKDEVILAGLYQLGYKIE